MTFETHADRWLTARITLAPSTATGYAVSLKNRINPHVGHMPLNAVTRPMVKDLIGGLSAAGYAPGTVHNTYLVLALARPEGGRRPFLSTAGGTPRAEGSRWVRCTPGWAPGKSVAAR